MATVTRTNGASENFGAFGRTVQVLSCAATNMTQAQIEVLIAGLQATNTVSGISEFTLQLKVQHGLVTLVASQLRHYAHL
jgi:hypothetical protein